MKTLSMVPPDYDVTKHPHKNNYSPIKCNQMSGSKRVYRDENGSLIAEEPCEWEDAVRRIQEGKLEFGRHLSTSHTYRQRMKELRGEWRSIDDYCMHSFLGYRAGMMEVDGKLVKFVDTSSIPTVPNRMEIAPNDFPYYLSPDLGHFVLWSTLPLSRAVYDAFVESRFPSNQFEWQMFENNKKNKSVKSVVHLQLIVRKKNPEVPFAVQGNTLPSKV